MALDAVPARSWTQGSSFALVEYPVAQGAYAGRFGTDANDKLTHATHADFDFGTGDFSVRGWVYVTDQTGWQSIVANGNTTFTSGAVSIGFVQASDATDGKKLVIGWHNGTGYANIAIGTTKVLPFKRYYAEVSRVSGVVYVALDGTVEGSAAFTGALNFGNVQTFVGGLGWSTTDRFRGFIDDLIIEKGAGHGGHTSNYTVPTSPHTVGAQTVSLLSFDTDTSVITTEKVVGYAVAGMQDDAITADKAVAYAVVGASESWVVAEKVVGYAVINTASTRRPSVFVAT